MTAFTEVSVRVDGEAAEAVAEVLRPFAYQEGVVLEQLGDETNLDPSAMEPSITVKIFFPIEEDSPSLRLRIEEILYHLNRLYPVPTPSFKILEETDWANAWKEHYRPFRVGKNIWIKPSWSTIEMDNGEKPEDVVIILDPGMAFGTGLHPTTQMCLRALEDIVRPGDSVLDVGTGSGILAIAALKLGASRVLGVDTDEVAIQSAVENANRNNAGDVTIFWQGGVESVKDRGWNIVVVNILAPVIVKLLTEAELMGYLEAQGWLVLSGIIDSQTEEIEMIIRSCGGSISQKLTVRDWVTLLVHKNPSK